MSETTLPGQYEKLTDWAKEPSIMDLKADLDATKPSHDAQIAQINRWNDLRNVTGSQRPKRIKGRSSVQPKLIRRQAEWRYSALSEAFLGSEKLFSVDPHTFEDEPASRQNELVINWQFNTKLNKVKFIDEYVRTTVDEGTCIVRVGWKRVTKTNKVMVPIYEYAKILNPQDMEVLEKAMALQMENPNEFLSLPPEIIASVEYSMENNVPVVARAVGEEEIEEEEIVDNRPTVTIMHPDNVFIDPACEGDYEKADFIIISYETSKAELVKDGRFKNLDKVNWESNTILSQPDHYSQTPNDFQRRDELKKKVIAYEYWGWHNIDGDDYLKPISATWIGDVMVRMEESPFPDEKPPFVVVNYLPKKREVFGEPDAEILEDNQKILGAVTRGMIDLMARSANSQTGFAKGFMDVTNRRKFEAGQDYEFNPGGDPRMSTFMHQYPEIPNSALTMVQLQNQEAEALSGVKSFAGGVSGEAYGEVAAGIKGVLDASAKREMNILRRLAKGMCDIGTKIMAMNALFLSEEEVIRITNKEFVTVRREDLKGNFDMVVDIATAEVDNQKATDLGFMLQTMGPNMDPEMSKMVLGEIARLKRMPTLSEQILRFKPQPDPMLEEMKKLELQEKQMTVAKLQSEIDLNNAKTAEAQAGARLTMIEGANEESGLNHERDLQKQKAQAKGNQSLEVTKGLLKPLKENEKAPNIEAAVGFNELSKMLDRE